MLVFGRRTGESIMIGDDISITVSSICDQSVKIGINAPKHIPVHRHEVYMRIRREKDLNMNDREKTYKAMIQELVDEGLYDFSKVDPARAEDIAWAKFGISDDSADLLYEAEDWHCDARVAALQNGQYHEAYRLTRDGMRVIMGERHDGKKYIKGPVQIDLDAAAEADRFNRKMDTRLTKAAFDGAERV